MKKLTMTGISKDFLFIFVTLYGNDLTTGLHEHYIQFIQTLKKKRRDNHLDKHCLVHSYFVADVLK